MPEVLQYASPAPRAEQPPARPWIRFLKLVGLLVAEIVLVVILSPLHVELIAISLGVLTVLTALATFGAFLMCLVPAPATTLSLPERRTLIGECARCGYDVLRIPSADRCPECGRGFAEVD